MASRPGPRRQAQAGVGAPGGAPSAAAGKEATGEAAAQRQSAVYALLSADRRATYVGYSVDVRQRLRKHNGEIAGGARATARRGRRPWALVACVYPFLPGGRDRTALMFEWAWKRAGRSGRRRGKGRPAARPVDRRFAAVQPAALRTLLRNLATTLDKKQWTRAAVPAKDHPALRLYLTPDRALLPARAREELGDWLAARAAAPPVELVSELP